MKTLMKPTILTVLICLFTAATVVFGENGIPSGHRFQKIRELYHDTNPTYLKPGAPICATIINVCKDTLNDRLVVIKAGNGPYRPYLANEAKIYGRTSKLAGVIEHYETIVDDKWRYEVLEYCPDGDLLGLIEHKKSFSEDEARPWLMQILSSLSELHDKKIAHMDIKPDNFFLSGKDIKIGDFGLSEYFGARKKLSYHLKGSSTTMAPEVVYAWYAPYDPFKADVFSVGIVLVTMILGTPLYNQTDESDINWQAFLDFETPDLIRHYAQMDGITLSHDLMDLVVNMLNKDPKERFTMKQALEHAWLTPKTITSPKATQETKPQLEE